MAVTSMANSSIRDFTKYNRMSSVIGVPPYECQYLVIAGGGGGGNQGAGGGAGGYVTSTLNASGVLRLTVGAGGAGAVPSGATYGPGSAGSNSVFDSVTSIGGGFGGGGASGSW